MSSPAALVPVTVVVPVYDAAEDLRRCVDSLLACTQSDHRLLLIDDASPDAAVRAYFEELAARALPHVTLLANERNLGFTGTANRGFSQAAGDVVLLNSDTIVTSGWLDALLRCAATDPCIGTATPFSNNAEILSFPRFCENNVWPQGADPEPVRAALAESAVPTYPELPTGVGFCLFVRRALLDAIGGFDPAFGAGYGEENDLCMRAANAGWRNVLCDDAFVLHTGERSFKGRREALVARHMQLLLDRHPDYMDLVRSFIAADPLAALREAALARLSIARGPARAVLHVVSRDADASRVALQARIDASRERGRHCVAVMDGDLWRIDDRREPGRGSTATFEPLPGESLSQFLRGLCATYRIGRVEVEADAARADDVAAACADAGIACCVVDRQSAEVSLGAGSETSAMGADAFDDAPVSAFDDAAAFPRARVRDAFGYRPWTVRQARRDAAARAVAAPVAAAQARAGLADHGSIPGAAVADPALAVAPAPLGAFARAALRARRTVVGRLAVRLVPGRMRAALRNRLR
jgi:GT2 family glycosyltransferase